MTNNQPVFPATGSDRLNQGLQPEQGLFWEFYKTWVNNQTELDSTVAQGTEMFVLYERLSQLLNVSLKSGANSYDLNEKALLKFSEKNFAAVINFITDVIAPEKIFCLNHRSEADGKDHADLILIIPERSSKPFEEIEKVIDFVCLKHHHLTCTLFKASFFYKMIEEGHVYFSLACSAKSLIYDDGSKVSLKLKLDNSTEKIEKIKKEFYTGLEKAKTFYVTAQYHKTSTLTMAAFMLHQAAELCLRNLCRSLIKQERTTHSLKTLLKFSVRITTRLVTLMNENDPEDERLLTILDGAYLGYRYSEKYCIDENDLDVLFVKVQSLQHYTEDIFLEWMERYELLINTTANDQA